MISRAILLLFFWTANCQKPEGIPYCCADGEYAEVGEQVCFNGVTNTTTKIVINQCGTKELLSLPEESMLMVLGDSISNYRKHGFDAACYAKNENETEINYVACTTEDIEVEVVWLPYLFFISVFFMILTMVVYFMVPQLLDIQGICIVHVLFGLALGFIFLLTIRLYNNHSPVTCEALAFMNYICFIYAFFWISALGFHIWRSLLDLRWLRIKGINWLWAYHIYAIGGTLVLFLITLIPHLHQMAVRPGFNEGRCWFRTIYEQFLFFYIPILILIIINIIFFGWTIYYLWNKIDRNHSTAVLFRLKMCLKLFIIMGIPWIFEIIGAAVSQWGENTWDVLINIVNVFNALQGLLIFLVLVVFRKRVRKELSKRKICGVQCLPSHWEDLEDEEADNLVFDRTTVEFHNVPNNDGNNGLGAR